MAEKIVISGIGVLAPNGLGTEAFGEALRGGQSGIGKIEGLDLSALHTKAVGSLDETMLAPFLDNEEGSKRLDRTTALALVAGRMAMDEAQWGAAEETEGLRRGIVVGSAHGPALAIEDIHGQAALDQNAYLKPSSLPKSALHAPASALAARHGIDGPNTTVATSCASALVAVALATQTLRQGAADILLVGGVDCPIAQTHLRLWDAQRLLSRANCENPEATSRPFSADRSGIVLSEGCGFIVLEKEGSAQARNAPIHAEILGAGQSCAPGASHEGRVASMALAMEEAIRAGKVKKSKIDHVQASAAGSPSGDAAEAAAVARVFGRSTNRVAVSSIKSMIGHAAGAAGMLSLIAVLLGMRDGLVAPTTNLDTPDPECSLDLVAHEARYMSVDTALINAFSHDGQNASVVVRKVG